jgi:hypothetical protein
MDQRCSAGSRFGERAEQVRCSARATRLTPICTGGGGGGGGRHSGGEALAGGTDGERSSGGHEKGSRAGVAEGAELLELAVEAPVLLC